MVQVGGAGRRPTGLCGAGGRGWEETCWPLWYRWGGLGGDLLVSVVQVGGAGRRRPAGLCSAGGRGWEEETCSPLWYRWEGLGRRPAHLCGAGGRGWEKTSLVPRPRGLGTRLGGDLDGS